MKVIRVLIFPKTKSLDFGPHSDGYEILMPWLRLDMALSDVDDFLKQNLFFMLKHNLFPRTSPIFVLREIYFLVSIVLIVQQKELFFWPHKKNFSKSNKVDWSRFSSEQLRLKNLWWAVDFEHVLLSSASWV